MTGRSVTTTPMFTNAWTQSQAVMPAARSAPKVSGAARAIAEPTIREEAEEPDHDHRADEAELLPDHREDVVIVGVRQDDAAG